MSITKADITTKITSILSELANNRKVTATDINELKRVTDATVDYVLALPTRLAPFVSVAVNYLALVTDEIISVTAAGVVLTLPTAAVATAGFEYTIDNASNGPITVVGQGAETIQGESVQTLPSDSTMRVYSNGVAWRIT